MTVIQRKNRSSLKYPDLHSARLPDAQYNEIHVLVYLPDISTKDSSRVQEKQVVFADNAPHPFSQNGLITSAKHLKDCKWSSRKLSSLMVFKSLSSSEIQILKTLCTKWNWKQESLFFCPWKSFLKTSLGTTQNLPETLCNVQIFRSFCKKLVCHITNTNIDDCLLSL